MSADDIITEEGNPHALIVRAADEKSAILLMDRTDLDQAMAELRGEVVETFVYVPKGGKNTLSYAGIKEAARLYRNVHFGATATPLADGSWMITSYAHNLADNTRCDYPMPYPSFDPRDTRQAIEFRASISKSIRNALAAVLPIAYLNTMIARWMEEKGASGVAPSRPASGLAAKAEKPAPAALTLQTSQRDRATTEQAAQTSAADWTREQVAAHIRQIAGVTLSDLSHWQDLARTYGSAVPVKWNDMTQTWLLELYQAMQARGWEERIRLATTEEEVSEARSHALSDRDKRRISTEQYTRLYDVAERRYAELSGPLTAQAV